MQHVQVKGYVTSYHDTEGLVFGYGSSTQDGEQIRNYNAYDLQDPVWASRIREGLAGIPNSVWGYAMLRHGQPWLGQGEYCSLAVAWEKYKDNTAPRWIRRKINALKKELGMK